MQFNGQWIGQYSGSNTGTIVIEIDDMGSEYEGYARTYDGNPELPNSHVYINIPKNTENFSINAQILSIDPRTGNAIPYPQIKEFYNGNVIYPTSAQITFQLTKKSLAVEWVTDIGTVGNAELPKSKADTPSEYIPDSSIKTWDEFKKYINELEHRRFIFRGQNGSWRLRTSFHRKGRVDLVKFIRQDIQALHRNLSARTNHIFNLSIPDENGAFFNLVQHHGYPTPLLDWTYSPYVAAFFAYREKNKESEKVRILLFDQKQWRYDYLQLSQITNIRLHFSLMEFIAIDNERMIPQQALSSITNIDDIETYIRKAETCSGKKYLNVIELPREERSRVMLELSTMGITAGSLFPGLDGACEELKERFFNNASVTESDFIKATANTMA